ncbi:MAG: hypothetical protein Q8N23_06505 [Archangium sp.]|nr:hypothetical protein [Archangium sp.]MDP3570700.1 hypothetical protein [Archangium sp.]
MGDWRFRVMQKSEQNRAPVEGQFFEDVDSLVREAVQNSLDAALKPGDPTSPVRFRMAVSSQKDVLSPGASKRWLDGLQNHVAAAIEEPPDFGQPLAFVTLEDFGTRGLAGRPEIAREVDIGQGQRADFFYFWRNVGITGKTGAERGSWGLGKAVFAASSLAHTMFGWTVRSEKPESLLMGQSALRLHSLQEKSGPVQYDSYGFFGEFKDSDPAFCTPITDPKVIEQFALDFKLRRDPKKALPGTSLVVPFPREDFLEEEGVRRLVQSTIDHFFFPILAGHLVVEVSSAGKTIEIAALTIEQRLKEMPWIGKEARRDRLLDLLALARWALGNRAKATQLSTNDALGAEWEDIQQPAEWPEVRSKFVSQQPVAISVPVLVRMKGTQRHETRFEVFMKQTQSAQPNLVHFIRQGLTITEVQGPAGTGLLAIVVVDDQHLSRLLRDSENPAHTRWNVRSEKLKSHFIGGPSRIDFVSAAPRQLSRRLIDSKSETDTEMLADLFPEPAADAPTVTVSKTRKKGQTSPPMLLPPKPEPRPLSLIRINGGFQITRNGDVALDADDDVLLVEAAYDCLSGNPFKQWEEFDFDVSSSEFTVEIAGGEVRLRSDNQIRCVVGNDFHLKVTGFEVKRDLVVRHRWLRGES